MSMTIFDTFAGIGGFSLGAQWAGGFETVGFCEKDAYCQRVLGKHWPNLPIIEDICDVTIESLRSAGIGRPDIITAGFPCQPFSKAGKQKGVEDDRYLWPQLYEAIRSIRPIYVVLENVPRLLSIKDRTIKENPKAVFGVILGQLAEAGYDAEWRVISAEAVGAWHQRDRLWVICYPNRQRWGQQSQNADIGQNSHNRQRDTSANSQRHNQLHSFKPASKNSNANGNGQHTERGIWRGTFGPLRGHQEIPDPASQRLQGQVFAEDRTSFLLDKCYRELTAKGAKWSSEPPLARLADGVSDWSHQIRAYGNAIVPQLARVLFLLIAEYERENRFLKLKEDDSATL